MRRIAALALLAAVLPAGVAANDSYVCPGNGDGLHQLRIYEINPDNRDAFHARFQDHALRIMDRHGFEVVDMWESDTGDKLEFVYVLSWPDRQAMESSWERFLADQEWIDIKQASAASGVLVRASNGQPLERVSYSPACALS